MPTNGGWAIEQYHSVSACGNPERVNGRNAELLGRVSTEQNAPRRAPIRSSPVPATLTKQLVVTDAALSAGSTLFLAIYHLTASILRNIWQKMVEIRNK